MRAATVLLIAASIVSCSLGAAERPRTGGTPTPGGPAVDPQRVADMAALIEFSEENGAPWTALGDTDEGFVVTSGRGDPELEARARALISTSLSFEYGNAGRPVPATPLPPDPSLIAVPTLERYGSCHLLPGLEGTVVADPRWVLAFRPDAGQPWAGQVIKVYWPAGWTARREGDRLALLDAMRTVVAHEGDTVVLGGGEQYEDGYWACFVQAESP